MRLTCRRQTIRAAQGNTSNQALMTPADQLRVGYHGSPKVRRACNYWFQQWGIDGHDDHDAPPDDATAATLARLTRVMRSDCGTSA